MFTTNSYGQTSYALLGDYRLPDSPLIKTVSESWKLGSVRRELATDLRSTNGRKNKPERAAEMGPDELGLPAWTNARACARARAPPGASGTPQRRRVINSQLKVFAIAEKAAFFASSTLIYFLPEYSAEENISEGDAWTWKFRTFVTQIKTGFWATKTKNT